MKTPVLIAIPIHSFVDLITNSSTEIYIQAKQKTVDTVKEIINHLLKIGNEGKPAYSADDLFEISLFNTSAADRKEYGEDDEERDCDTIILVVKEKYGDSELQKKTAELISALFGTLEVGESYDY
jgi:hypothetical protein